jgi:hypothetical protein
MTVTHDNHDEHSDHDPNLEYRRSVAWQGFVAVIFILIILIVLFGVLKPIQFTE